MSLLGVKVLELDLGALTAGCMMPGEFEERLKAVLNEIEALRGRAVLFIDDIHNLVPVGGVQVRGWGGGGVGGAAAGMVGSKVLRHSGRRQDGAVC